MVAAPSNRFEQTRYPRAPVSAGLGLYQTGLLPVERALTVRFGLANLNIDFDFESVFDSAFCLFFGCGPYRQY